MIFDYNGVLANDLQLHEDAYLEFARRHHLPLTRKKIKNIMPLPVRKKIEIVTGEKDPAEVDKLMREKEQIYIDLAKAQGLISPATQEVIMSLSKIYVLAIVTNTTKNQLFGVCPQEFLEKFKIILTYEDIDRPKPAPDSLLLVLKKLRVKKTETCYIGDSIADIAAAKNAGILAIGISTGYYPQEQLLQEGADIIISSLPELEKVLKASL